MDTDIAARLAASVDPKALAALQNRNGDPAVGRAVAGQFGAFLMQGMMQGADGSAMSMAGGTGGPAVSSMFASVMGRYAMSGDKLGLADAIYRSMAAKGGVPDAKQGAANGNQTSPVAATASDAATPTHTSGISLAPYWEDRGHRPVGAPIGRMTPPPVGQVSQKKGAGLTKPHDTTSNAPAAKQSPTVTKQSPVSTATQTPTAPTKEVATASPAPQQGPRMHWLGLSLPAQARVQLPPAESEAANSTTTPAVAATAAPANAQTTPPTSQTSDAGGPIPHGLPWTHTPGGDAGAPHHDRGVKTSTGNASLDEAEGFAEKVAPAIETAAARLGVSPRTLLAQAALETGWGHSVVGNNIFGIKAGASWSGATVTAGTHEMEGGRLVAHQATFRSYANVNDAVTDYVGLVSASSRYRAALGAGDNVAAYADALAAGGYASDRDYATKLEAVANSSKMTYAVASLDEEPPGHLISEQG